MTHFELWSLVVMGVQTLALIPTLAFAAYQLHAQRKQMEQQRLVLEYEVYQRVSQANVDLLWRAVEHPELNSVWEPMDEQRKAVLDTAQSSRRWGAWLAMTDEERMCYRFTRAALEIAEQAWEVRQRDMVSDESWEKWDDWADIWSTSRYFRYVFEDEHDHFLPGFVRFIEKRL